MNKRLVKKCVSKWLANENLNDIELGFADDFQFDGDGSKNDHIDICEGYNYDFSMLEKLIKELGYKGNANVITIAFLHELGHHFTIKEFDELERESDNEQRKLLYTWIDGDDETMTDIGLELYYRLPQEIRATQWAINFATKHPIKTKRLEKALDID